jgi:hypothetical protein
MLAKHLHPSKSTVAKVSSPSGSSSVRIELSQDRAQSGSSSVRFELSDAKVVAAEEDECTKEKQSFAEKMEHTQDQKHLITSVLDRNELQSYYLHKYLQ